MASLGDHLNGTKNVLIQLYKVWQIYASNHIRNILIGSFAQAMDLVNVSGFFQGENWNGGGGGGGHHH